MNIESRRECKDLMTILEKSVICFITCSDEHELKHHLFGFKLFILNCLEIDLLCTYKGQQLSCRLLEFVSHWILNKYMRLFESMILSCYEIREYWRI